MTLAFACLLSGQDPEVVRIRKDFDAVRPGDGELAIFRLDWEPDFKTARARAAKERRPLLFLWNSNNSGPDNPFTGHC